MHHPWFPQAYIHHQGKSRVNRRQLTSPCTAASDTASHPYACVVPSRHAPDTACYPYARGVPSRHAPDTAYHPYARGVHSRHAPNTTSPYACVVPPNMLLTPLIHTLV
ncbi:hypothetical protein O181_095309 [Austropuccinia psidii MF-1]|uniref:Uncharacterized protein n=1 Tax=Austropuccinia psidii MF-1 TaxID=1389203 RepID=A0A9Q3J526_9BASI|nr:hypothetical protein [Austropuccinia psidii MF-1]